MAYLHCHNCSWSQDDFYSWHYNPITKIIDDIKWLWKPRWFEMDKDIIDDLVKYTGVKIKIEDKKVHSWNWLHLEIAKNIKVAKETKWWTYESWKNDKNRKCPKCKSSKCFDID